MMLPICLRFYRFYFNIADGCDTVQKTYTAVVTTRWPLIERCDPGLMSDGGILYGHAIARSNGWVSSGYIGCILHNISHVHCIVFSKKHTRILVYVSNCSVF